MKLDKSNIDKFIFGTILRCSERGLTGIEDIPDHITKIYCYENKFTSLPKLPSGLIYLDCEFNQLTSLPHLPDSLTELWCMNNKLPTYPKHSEDKQWMDLHNKWLNRIDIINKINENR